MQYHYFRSDFAVRYFSEVSGWLFLPLLHALSVHAAPISLPRDGTLSASFNALPKPVLSPYYVYFGNPQTKKLVDAFDAPLNLKAATVGFASAPKGQCALDSDLDGLVGDVTGFIGKGGAVAISFGGNLQDQTVPRQHVQQACTDVDKLVKLIEGAMSQFKTHNIEFDIEDDSLLKDTDAAKRLAQALVQVKKDFPDTFVTYTVGANTNGMPKEQVSWVQAAKDNGLTIDVLTLMTMNMGGKDNVKDAQNAIQGGAAQLKKIYSLSADDAIKKMGMLPAIGVDNNRQIIDLQGIATLSKFAKSGSLAIMSYWNFNRDFPGNVGSAQQKLDTSSPDQKDPSQFLTTIQSSINGGGQGAAKAGTGSAPSIADGISSIQPSDQQPGQKDSLPPANPNNAPGGASVTPQDSNVPNGSDGAGNSNGAGDSNGAGNLNAPNAARDSN